MFLIICIKDNGTGSGHFICNLATVKKKKNKLLFFRYHFLQVPYYTNVINIGKNAMFIHDCFQYPRSNVKSLRN